ncbi:hypothetical protein JHK85_056753 [Glycine max]|nr:hypothetical protein JHK85_056753 [Glycine max]
MPFHYPKVLENGQQPRFRSQHQGFWSARDRNGTTIMATSTFVRNFPQNHETRQNRNRGRYLKPCNLAVPLKTHNNNLQTKNNKAINAKGKKTQLKLRNRGRRRSRKKNLLNGEKRYEVRDRVLEAENGKMEE